MILDSIETFSNENVGFVRVTTEDGLHGWGQVSTYHSDITCQILHRQVAPWILGKDTSQLDNLLDIVTEREHKFPGSYLRRAMAGFDTAVWDLRGKQQGKARYRIDWRFCRPYPRLCLINEARYHPCC